MSRTIPVNSPLKDDDSTATPAEGMTQQSHETRSRGARHRGPSRRRLSPTDDPVGFAFLLVTAFALAVRASILKDAYFITDDFMLSARAMENPLSWSYLTRVHTGHFEPIGFTVMWVLAHAAPLNWGWTVVVLLAGQLLLSVMVWRLLVEVFDSRPLTLVPYVIFSFTPLTLPAFSWLAAAIIWLPLMIAIAGALRWHARYVRVGGWKPAAAAVAWFIVGLASFEKIAVYLPFVVAFTLAVSPATTWTLSSLRDLLRRTWLIWLGYALASAAYLVIYLPGYRSLGNDTPVTPPHPGTLGDFAFLSIFRTLIPATFGGPWSWQRVSYALGIVDSPRAFDWACWVLALLLVVGSLLVRRRVARFWVALLIYLAGSIATVAVGRVAYGGSIVALETRYLADTAIPLAVTIGACLLPLRGEKRPWTPPGLRLRAGLPRPAILTTGLVGCALVVGLSFNSMNGFASIISSNPSKAFVGVTKNSLKSLPDEAEIVDTEIPSPIVGPIFGDYNLVSRYLSPLVSRQRDQDTRERRTYTIPHVMDASGAIVPMTVQGAARSSDFMDCWVVDDGRVSVPLTNGVFPWGWVMRIGYLSDREFDATVRLGDGVQTIPVHKGLGEVFVRLQGSGDRVLVTDVPPGVKFCVGDIQVGTPVPAG